MGQVTLHKIITKNVDLNNILTDYSISAMTNSYILSYYANSKTKHYKSVQKEISINLDPIIDEETGLTYVFNDKNQFNLQETYNYNESLLTNNIIVANVGNKLTSYNGSYIIYYNTNDGLRQLSYHYKEGNGIYYDKKTHLIGMNIDNNTIKESNKKLFFDTNSIPISSLNNYGISYVDTEYMTIDNGILSIKSNLIENIISYKYKIQSLYNSLYSIYSAFSYYDNIYITKNDTTNIFVKYFNNVLKNDKNNMLERKISYETTSSLFFPNSQLQYYDNYYFTKNLIDEQYKEFIPLNNENSYMIYCKDPEQLTICSYIENSFLDNTVEFNDNLFNNIELGLNNSGDDQSIEIVDQSNLYSYIYIDETNKYNKILVNTNIINRDYITLYDINTNKYNHYSYTTNKIRFKSKPNDDKIFRKNGIILNSKINNSSINKCIVDYYLNDNTINYDLQLKRINVKYDNRNIKILYDDRDIAYCVCNNYPIQDKSKNYFWVSCANLSNDIKNNLKTGIIYKKVESVKTITETKNNNIITNIETNITEDIQKNNENIEFIIKNSDVCFNTNLSYLFYGYNWTYNNKVKKYNKKYYTIWDNIATTYITPGFVKILNNLCDNNTNETNNIVLFNFDELYTENFNEVEYNVNTYGAPDLNHSHKLYLCEFDSEQKEISNQETITEQTENTIVKIIETTYMTSYFIHFVKPDENTNITIDI